MGQIELLIGTNGNVDFKNPVRMSKIEIDEFTKLMNKMFYPVTISESTILERSRLNNSSKLRRIFHKEEYAFLLNSSSVKDASIKLGMPKRVIIRQMREVIPNYFSWCEKNNIEDELKYVLDNINKFAQEYNDHKEKMKKIYDEEIKPLKREMKKISRRIYKLSEKLPELDKTAEENKGTRTGKDAELDAKSRRSSIKEFEEKLNNIKEKIKSKTLK